jgi:hypothetical protein
MTRDKERILFYIGLVLMLLIITGCQVHNPLPGLCYTDKTGTYICLNEDEDQAENQ